MCLQYKSFYNTVGKGEIACNKQFLLFPQRFLLTLRTFCHFHRTLNCCLQTLSVSKSLKNYHLGKGSNFTIGQIYSFVYCILLINTSLTYVKQVGSLYFVLDLQSKKFCISLFFRDFYEEILNKLGEIFIKFLKKCYFSQLMSTSYHHLRFFFFWRGSYY